MNQRYHDGLLDGLLDLHPLPCDGLIQLPFKGQQVHVGLGLWDQVSDLQAGNQELRTSAKCNHTVARMRHDLRFRNGVSSLTLCGSTLSAILRLLALKHQKPGDKMRSVPPKRHMLYEQEHVDKTTDCAQVKVTKLGLKRRNTQEIIGMTSFVNILQEK